MEDSTLLQMFDGNFEGLQYYKKLRESTSEEFTEDIDSLKNQLCDPNDEIINSRLRDSGYTYKAVLKSTEEIFQEYSGSLGYEGKQTALGTDQHVNMNGENKEDDQNMDCSSDSPVFTCGQAGCTMQFSSLAEYESHYATAHKFTCSVCRRVLPSAFMLDVHVEENHDSYFLLLAARRDMYRCLVECCNLKFPTPELRSHHLVTDHHYPADFAFHQPIPPPPRTSVAT